LEASNLSPRTIRADTDDGAVLAAFLARQGMPTAVASIRREHVEAFIAAELERTAPSFAVTRDRSLQQLFKWLDDEGEISGSPMVKMRPPIIPEQSVPVLSDDQVRAWPDGRRERCSPATRRARPTNVRGTPTDAFP
jgi:site-specific recombinase XerD